jgi:hypothetical protein
VKCLIDTVVKMEGKMAHRRTFEEYGEKFGKGNVVSAYIDFEGDEVSLTFTKNGEGQGDTFETSKAELGDGLLPHGVARNVKFEEWCQTLRAACLIGDQETRNAFIRDMIMPDGQDVVVTVYEMILREKSVFRKFNWKDMVIDEALRVKDKDRQIQEYDEEGGDKFFSDLYASDVILFDRDRNPQMDMQAMDRVLRIGQKKQVRVFRLVVKNTVDKKIVEKAEVKLKLDQTVINAGKLAGQEATLGPEERRMDGEQRNVELQGKRAAVDKSDLRTFTVNNVEEKSAYALEGEDFQRGEVGGTEPEKKRYRAGQQRFEMKHSKQLEEAEVEPPDKDKLDAYEANEGQVKGVIDEDESAYAVVGKDFCRGQVGGAEPGVGGSEREVGGTAPTSITLSLRPSRCSSAATRTIRSCWAAWGGMC